MTPTVETDQTRVLVVDDDPVMRDLLSRWLTDSGYLCAQAANSREASMRLGEQLFQLITLDIRMPEVSGLELLARIRDEDPEVAILMLSGEGDTSAAVQALTSGADGYVQKPTDKNELAAQCRKVLEHRRVLTENRQYTANLAEKVREQTASIIAAHEETVDRLVRASLYRDDETGSHIQRTGLFSELLAQRVGWNADCARLIRLAAPLHDIGKIGIPDAILRKPGPLTKEEMQVMRTHTVIGGLMLEDSELPMLKMAREIALYHHEHWDGAGYCHGRSGYAIPESARIVAIVDVYDALSHDRVYRPALPLDEVVTILKRGRGRHFDPSLLDEFLSLIPQLHDSEKSLVQLQNRHTA